MKDEDIPPMGLAQLKQEGAPTLYDNKEDFNDLEYVKYMIKRKAWEKANVQRIPKDI